VDEAQSRRLAGVTHYIKHYKDEETSSTSTLRNVLAGGLKAVRRNRALTGGAGGRHECGPITSALSASSFEEVDDE